MDFALSSDHEMIRQTVPELAEKGIRPVFKELDRRQDIDRRLLPKMADIGHLGICIPVRFGGAGLHYLSLGPTCEKLEWVESPARAVASVHVSAKGPTRLP